jgi:hypothetical protein
MLERDKQSKRNKYLVTKAMAIWGESERERVTRSHLIGPSRTDTLPLVALGHFWFANLMFHRVAPSSAHTYLDLAGWSAP